MKACILFKKLLYLLSIDKQVDLAKIYGNRSAAHYQLSNTDADQLTKALDDGKKAVEYDVSYEKGHFRFAYLYKCVFPK
jgi:intergrase/recombinase